MAHRSDLHERGHVQVVQFRLAVRERLDAPLRCVPVALAEELAFLGLRAGLTTPSRDDSRITFLDSILRLLPKYLLITALQGRELKSIQVINSAQKEDIAAM